MRIATKYYWGLEGVSLPQWRIGHMELAVRPNEPRNVLYEVEQMGPATSSHVVCQNCWR